MPNTSTAPLIVPVPLSCVPLCGDLAGHRAGDHQFAGGDVRAVGVADRVGVVPPKAIVPLPDFVKLVSDPPMFAGSVRSTPSEPVLNWPSRPAHSREPRWEH